MNDNETRESDGKSSPVWEREKEFTKEINRGKWTEKLAVVVAISDHDPFYRYSVRCGVLREKDGETSLFPFVNPFVKNQQFGKAVVDESLLEMTELLRQAHQWILEDAQAEADCWIDEHQSKPVSQETVPRELPRQPARRRDEHVAR